MNCKRCEISCVKAGKQRNGKQKYICKKCNLYQQDHYVYAACKSEIHNQFSRMNRLGCGSLKAANFLGVSINTLQKWVGKALRLIDELQTCVGDKETKVWIAYGWNVGERIAVALHVGRRRSEDLVKVTSKVMNLSPSKVNTDNYSAYPNLLKGTVHKKGKRKANHIEREHVNLRKDVANLIQKTICYAKNIRMLEARIRWYFWGENDPYFFLK
jgi:insertion element IS1 protein InsB